MALFFISLLIVMAISVFMATKENFTNDFELPKEISPLEKKIFLMKDGKKHEEFVMETKGVLHSVFLDEIADGGPKRDGIPAINDPKFVNIGEAEKFLADDDPGVVFYGTFETKFYPFKILAWHNIVNDFSENENILVTYCPLCFCGIVFNSEMDNEKVAFGTTGKLWNSNLVIYDKKTNSLWSQILGKAIVGQMTGVSLKRLASEQMCFSGFKKMSSEGMVLSFDTGFFRFYDSEPYGDYYLSDQVYFPVNFKDNRLRNKDFVLGVVLGKMAKAYWIEKIQQDKYIEDFFAGRKIIVKYNESIGNISMFEEKNGEVEKIYPLPTFWFSWIAIYPYTEVYK